MPNSSLEWGKLIIPSLVTVLIASEGWQYFAAPGKIKQETSAHVDDLLVKNLERKLDSISIELAKKEFAAKSLEDAVSVIKGKNHIEANKYLMQVFEVADEAIKNDSNWRHVQRPFIDWLHANKEKLEFLVNNNLICPVEDQENKLHFNWLDGLHAIKKQNVNGGQLYFWRDQDDDKHYLQSISTIKDN